MNGGESDVQIRYWAALETLGKFNLPEGNSQRHLQNTSSHLYFCSSVIMSFRP